MKFMKIIFWPAIALMDKMNFVTKFLFIGVALLAPFAYTTHVMIKNLDKQIIFNQKESYGVAYIGPSFQLLCALQECRLQSEGLRARVLTQDSGMKDALRAMQELLPVIDALDMKYREDFKTEGGAYACSERWRELRQLCLNVQAAREAGLENGNPELDQLPILVSDWILNYSANFSNLILDPDLDSYWLMDAYVAKLPQLNLQISQLGTLIVRHGKLQSGTSSGAPLAEFTPAERLELSGLCLEAEHTLDSLLSVNFKTAYDFNSSRGKNLQAHLQQHVDYAVERARKLLAAVKDGYLLHAAPQAPASEIATATHDVLTGIQRLHDRIGPELDALIQNRVSAYQVDRTWGTLAAEGATFLHVYIFIAFYLAVNHSVFKLSQFTTKMINGTTERFELKNRDEIGKIAAMYNQLNEELNLVRGLKQQVELEKKKAEEDRRKAEALAEQLGCEIAERVRMQDQLVQAQKLESIGQLAAGIAHEINTPIQYIGDNVRFLDGAFSDINGAFPVFSSLIKTAQNGPVPLEQVASAAEALRKSDAEYLSEEIPKAITQTLEGVDRVAKIVSAMKEFSHPGSKEKTLTDLNHAIRTTLTVANNEYKYVANLVENFDHELPPVPVLPGEFNQVILNLVVNAAHAIGEKINHAGNGEKGTITVRTRRDIEQAEIRISDTGTGIPESVRHKIFDPFFTTKEVGKGTGQGLAIARSTIEDKHGGTLTFETDTGKGTTFVIRLPLTQPAARKSKVLAF